MGHSTVSRAFAIAAVAALLPISNARALSWTQLSPAGTTPGATDLHSEIYDPVGQRMMDYQQQGAAGQETYMLSLTGTPTWSRATSGSADPSPPRFACATTFDSARDRMLIFAGTAGGSPSNEVWALSLGATPAWSLLSPVGTPPDLRSSATAIYDAPRDRMVVYGGSDAGWNAMNDVWALSLAGTPTWTQLTPTGAPGFGRTSHTAIYDPVRERMIVYGGYDGYSTVLSDVWALSLNGTPAWTELTSGPSRDDHMAVYDPLRDRMLVFGGQNGTCFDETWELTLSGTPQWHMLAPTGARPPGRYAGGLTYDSGRDQLVLHGGVNYSTNFDDVWTLPLGGSVSVEDRPLANEIQFAAPSPNPAHEGASFAFALPHAARARLTLYDLEGRRVRTLLDEDVAAGSRSVRWDGHTLDGQRARTGVYFVSLEVEGTRHWQRLVVRN